MYECGDVESLYCAPMTGSLHLRCSATPIGMSADMALALIFLDVLEEQPVTRLREHDVCMYGSFRQRPWAIQFTRRAMDICNAHSIQCCVLSNPMNIQHRDHSADTASIWSHRSYKTVEVTSILCSLLSGW